MPKFLICVTLLEVIITFTLVLATEETSTPHSSTNDSSADLVDVMSTKHESLRSCSSFTLDPDEFIMFPNGTAYVAAYNRTYTEPFYALNGDTLTICAPTEVKENPDLLEVSPIGSETFSQLTNIGLAISVVFLLIHLVVFALVPDLQNLPGCHLASLCLSLFLSYVLSFISQNDYVAENETLCATNGVLKQYFFLASHLWMFVMSFDVFRSILHATGSLRVSSTGFKMKKYLWNSLIAWGTPLAFITAALIVDNIEGVPESLKPDFKQTCWFTQKQSLLAFFAGPVFTLICLNFLLFGISAYNIFSNRMKAGQDSQRSNLKKSHLMYFRLSVIMGVTWVMGALAPIVNDLWFWYVFVAINTLQGLFIFFAFTCTSKVKKHFRKKLFGDRRFSEQNVTPTFQSYCYYGNSIEKDLDKVVDNNANSGPTDTIVIHL